MAREAASTAYFTILAKNYLPKALTLADSLRRHEGAELTIVLIDAPTRADLPDAPGYTLWSTADLNLSAREITTLVTIYDLVEFATAIKPAVLLQLLETHESAYYLDPDLYLTSPIPELAPALAASEGGILLTPHFMEPPGPDADHSEAHLLYVGVYNLGFCGVDRRAHDFLVWWWSKLQRECLFSPLSGLFVDQKWVDIGAPLFHAAALRHYGYNVSVANLAERTVSRDDEGLVIGDRGDRLRLFHFHAFDPERPQELTTRFQRSTAHLLEANQVLEALCAEYAEQLLEHGRKLGPAPAYRYWTDSTGKELSRHLRRAYRQSPDPDALPSPFDPADREAWVAWRRRAWKEVARGLAGDAVKSVRVILPEESVKLRKKFPGLAKKARGNVEKSGLWG